MNPQLFLNIWKNQTLLKLKEKVLDHSGFSDTAGNSDSQKLLFYFVSGLQCTTTAVAQRNVK